MSKIYTANYTVNEIGGYSYFRNSDVDSQFSNFDKKMIKRRKYCHFSTIYNS